MSPDCFAMLPIDLDAADREFFGSTQPLKCLHAIHVLIGGSEETGDVVAFFAAGSKPEADF